MSSLEWFSNTVLLTIQYPPHEHVFCMLLTGRQTVFTRTHHQHSATLYLLYDEHKESPCAGLEEKKVSFFIAVKMVLLVIPSISIFSFQTTLVAN